MGNTLVALGRTEEALAAFQKVDATTLKDTKVNYPIQLARMAASEKWSAAGLSSLESNTLHLLESLMESSSEKEISQCLEQMEKENPDMSETAIWKLLVQMYQKPKSAPTARLESAASDNDASPILNYYLGVASMRKSEVEDAKTYWEKAEEGGLNSAWFTKNQSLLLSEQAQRAALDDQWEQIIATDYPEHLLEDTALGEIVAAAHDHSGYTEAQKNRWKQATDHWRKASEVLQNRRLIQNLALAEEKLGNWHTAAEAWRSVVRRRPRKTTHPDYLTDLQVSAIWRHAADCYEKNHVSEESILCFKNAIKYSEDDPDLRLELAKSYLATDRAEAAGNELNRLLEIDPEHVPALEVLGHIYSDSWKHDDMEIWRRIIKIKPSHFDARQALAEGYIRKSRGMLPSRSGFSNEFLQLFEGLSNFRDNDRSIKLLQKGLEELPGHPKLLLALGQSYIEADQHEDAKEILIQTAEASSGDMMILTETILGLLQISEDEAVLAMLPTFRENKKAVVPVWFTIIDTGFTNKVIDDEWFNILADEALLASQKYERFTLAYTLANLAELAHRHELVDEFAVYQKRIDTEVPKSGAAEFVLSFLAMDDDDTSKARRMLQRAKSKAKKAREQELLQRIEEIEMMLSPSAMGNILRMMEEMDIPPDFFDRI